MNRPTSIFKLWSNGIAVVTLISVTLAANAMTVNMGGDKPLDRSGLRTTYSETFDTGTDPKAALFGLLDIGTTQNDAWTGQMADGVYRLSNNTRADLIRYFHFDRVPNSPPGRNASRGALSVEVGIENDQGGATGIMFAFDPEKRHYSALFLFGSGNYAFYRRDESGLNKIMSGPIKDFRKTGLNELAIVARDEFMELYANGRMLGSVSYGSPPSGHVGLIAAGKGTHIFDNFNTYELVGVRSTGTTMERVETPDKPPAKPVNPLAPPPPPPDNPFEDRFIGEQMTLELEANAAAAYSGMITYGTQVFPVQATALGNTLRGTFTSEGNDFSFSARREGDALQLETDGAVYTLQKKRRPANPLAPRTHPARKSGASSPGIPQPRPPAGKTSMNYAMRMEMTETGESHQLKYRVDIEPMGQGHWLLRTLLSPDGKHYEETDDFLVDRHGGRIDPEMRPDPQSDAVIYYWFPGTAEIDGFSFDVSERAGFWIYRSTEAPERRMVFEQTTGRLVSAKSCVQMGCVFLEPVVETPGE